MTDTVNKPAPEFDRYVQNAVETGWTMPETIVIGPYYFRVEFVRGLRAEYGVGTRLAGQCDNVWNIIRIDPDMAPSKQFETLWHEILHSISHLTDESMSEHDVTVVAPYICAVLNLNAGVRSFVE